MRIQFPEIVFENTRIDMIYAALMSLRRENLIPDAEYEIRDEATETETTRFHCKHSIPFMIRPFLSSLESIEEIHLNRQDKKITISAKQTSSANVGMYIFTTFQESADSVACSGYLETSLALPAIIRYGFESHVKSKNTAMRQLEMERIYFLESLAQL